MSCQGGFISTGKTVYWETLVSDQKPLCSLQTNGIPFEGLVDTGADVSIICLAQWPDRWKKKQVSVTVSSLGSASIVYQSVEPLSCVGPEGQQGKVFLYIVLINVNFWGRDLLQQFGTFLSIPHISSAAKNMMFKMGYNPLNS